MKSTELIHDIIEEFGEDQDNRRLMQALRALRQQVQVEVRRKYASALQSAYKSTKNLY